MSNIIDMQDIHSLKDKRIQFARELATPKGRLRLGKFLIEGKAAIEWAVEAGIDIEYILLSPKSELPGTVPSDIDVFQVSEGLLKKVTGTNYIIPIVAVGSRKKSTGRSDFQVVLDDLNDFGNIGTIVRTCHAFGIDSIISTTKDIDLFQRKTVEASRGKVFDSSFRCFESQEMTLAFLRANNYQIITTSPHGESIQSLAELTDQPVALIVGNETHGVSEVFMRKADIVVQIPMHGAVESLNVGVATGISIYELRLKQVIGVIEKKIKSTLGREINVAGMLIQQALDKQLKKVSRFSSRQIVFMMVLKCDITMKIVDIQKQFGIPDAELEGFLEPLFMEKLIRPDTGDNLLITEKGVETLGKLWGIVENTEGRLLDGFTDQEKADFFEMLKRLTSNCVALINE